MYEYLLDYPDHDTVQPSFLNGMETDRSHDMFMSGYQKQRQRVYDRAHHMVGSGDYLHADVEDAKAEAGLVRAEAQVRRARGDQLGWVKHMLRRGSTARLGYHNPVELVASRLDMERSTARALVYLAERLGDDQIEGIQNRAVAYVRVLEETRLAEAGASAEVIARSRDMDLESVKRILQAHRKMSRADERRVFEGQYVAFQPSLDGSHMRLNGQLGALEAEICRQGLDRRGEKLIPAGEARPDPGLRRALALTTLCQDELDRNPKPANTTAERIRSARNQREPLLMVVANNPLAEASGFEQGTAVLAGARVGPDVVDLIGCVGRTEAITAQGPDIVHHVAATGIRPALRRAVLARDDGCTSTDAPPRTVSRCTTSCRDPKAATTHLRISPPCAGGTTTSPYTAEACVSIPNHHPGDDAFCHRGAPAVTGHPTQTPTPSPYSEPCTHPPTALRPEPARHRLPCPHPLTDRVQHPNRSQGRTNHRSHPR